MSFGCENLVDPKEKKLAEALVTYRKEKGALIPILQEAQEIYGYLPAAVLKYIGKETGIPLARIYGVVTFYAQFRLTPQGRNLIQTCLGTACHVRGGSEILEVIENKLKIKDKMTTEDNRFTLEVVACMGACGLAPLMAVNGQVFGRLQPEKALEILANFE